MMRCGRRVVVFLAGAGSLVGLSGCVSLGEYRKVMAANRNMTAEKEGLEQDLQDERTVADSLRTRVTSLEHETQTKGELVANLRQENDLLDGIRKSAQSALEDMAGRKGLGDITINAPKLPEPLDSALKRFADEHPSIVVYDPARGSVKWTADLLFPLGSDVVKETSVEALQSFAELLKSPVAVDFDVIIVGHTCTRPIVKAETKAKHPTNWHLSAHRAISVAFALQKYGYPPDRVGVMGYGEFRPVADNASDAGASKNRRVDVYLVPRGAALRGSNDRALTGGEALALAPSSR